MQSKLNVQKERVWLQTLELNYFWRDNVVDMLLQL